MKLALLTAVLKSFPERGLLPLQKLAFRKRDRNQGKEILEVDLAGPSRVVSLRSNVVRKRDRDLPPAF